MDRLWTPWRYSYITETKPPSGCVFCEKAGSGDDERDFVVHRGTHNYVLLNIYPYNNGHVMVVPYEHLATLEALPEEAAAEMMRLAQLTERHLRRVYRPQGINIGMNIGKSAGAGVAGHIHLHVLPRWPADSNFMTTVGETRVVPEELHETWRKLTAAFRGE